MMHERLKQPFYGFLGLAGGKIRWGETVYEAAARELREETDLIALDSELCGIIHKIDVDTAGDLLEDKFFYVLRVTEFEGELLEGVEEGKNYWMTEAEIYAHPKVFQSVTEALEMINGESVTFLERVFVNRPEDY